MSEKEKYFYTAEKDPSHMTELGHTLEEITGHTNKIGHYIWAPMLHYIGSWGYEPKVQSYKYHQFKSLVSYAYDYKFPNFF